MRCCCWQVRQHHHRAVRADFGDLRPRLLVFVQRDRAAGRRGLLLDAAVHLLQVLAPGDAHGRAGRAGHAAVDRSVALRSADAEGDRSFHTGDRDESGGGESEGLCERESGAVDIGEFIGSAAAEKGGQKYERNNDLNLYYIAAVHHEDRYLSDRAAAVQVVAGRPTAGARCGGIDERPFR